MCKFHTLPILVGALAALGSLAHGAPASSTSASAEIRLAADSSGGASEDWTGKKNEYEQKARQQLDDWRQKMEELSQKAKEKGSNASTQAQADLDNAWLDMKRQWRRLQKASANDRNDARESFERAEQKMKSAWDKLHS
ncbi:MAG TPA: hypothetical protein VKY65_08310 [Alphaproteobacteria bacterium]|nr:hypothetical protein [Alphaproteobacteria bacterium]